MSLRCTCLSVVCLAAILLPGSIPQAQSGGSHVRYNDIVDVVEKASPAVVNIHSERTARGPAVEEVFATNQSQHRSNGMGTGIIIDHRGYMVTNHHVVEDVNVIRVRLHDGGTFNAKVVGRDRENDLALLKIDAGRPLQTITIGTSSDLRKGETVIAIGNAYGYEHTVTAGVISALNRDVTLNKDVSYKQLIQTDASINPGNSGGPLLNVKGELVGVNVAIRAGAQGIGFVIPVDQMVQVVTDLMAKRRQTDLSPGMICRNRIQPDETPCRALEIDRIEPGSPASRAGLRAGDVVIRAGDIPIVCSIDLERAMMDRRPGEKVPIIVRRAGVEQRAELTLKMPNQLSRPVVAAATPEERAWRQLGLRLTPTTGDFVRMGQSRITTGLLVVDVNADSPCARAGIRAGDVLIGLHQWQTESLDNINYILTHPEVASFYPLRFYIVRAGEYRQGSLPAD